MSQNKPSDIETLQAVGLLAITGMAACVFFALAGLGAGLAALWIGRCLGWVR